MLGGIRVVVTCVCTDAFFVVVVVIVVGFLLRPRVRETSAFFQRKSGIEVATMPVLH